jgi:hypothetical protein
MLSPAYAGPDGVCGQFYDLRGRASLQVLLLQGEETELHTILILCVLIGLPINRRHGGRSTCAL